MSLLKAHIYMQTHKHILKQELASIQVTRNETDCCNLLKLTHNLCSNSKNYAFWYLKNISHRLKAESPTHFPDLRQWMFIYLNRLFSKSLNTGDAFHVVERVLVAKQLLYPVSQLLTDCEGQEGHHNQTKR